MPVYKQPSQLKFSSLNVPGEIDKGSSSDSFKPRTCIESRW
jgi:hypothetical protein